jgi:hypothetical protein
MSDYKSDADWFERDRRYLDHVRFLEEYYGRDVMKKLRNRGVSLKWRNGRLKQLPSVSDFPNHSELSDPELAELVVQRIQAWDALEDVTDTLGI